MTAGIVTIRVRSSDENSENDDGIRTLARWLRDEDELRGRVDIRNDPVRQGQMGAFADAVVVAVASGGSVTVLVTSLFGWLTHSRTAEKVTLTVESASGEKIDLSCGSAEDADRVLRAVQATLDGDE